jgi:hypothetical protein
VLSLIHLGASRRTKPDAPIPGLTEEQSKFFRYFDANGDGQISPKSTAM